MKKNFCFSREAIVEYILDKCLNKEFVKGEIKDIVEEIVDELLDLSNTVVSYNERSTYIIRKYFGIFDNGIYQSTIKIAQELGLTKQNIDATINRIFESLSYEISLRKNFSSDIYKLKLSTKTKNAIIESNIYTIEQLLAIDKKMLKTIISVGEIGFKEIIEKVHTLGYKFTDEVEINKEQVKIGDINISRLKLSNVTYNILSRSGIRTMEQLISTDSNNLAEINHLGPNRCEEIIEKVHALGYKFVNEKEDINELKDEKLNLKLSDINLSARTFNLLSRAGIFTLDQLISLSKEELITVRNLKKNDYDEIIEKIHEIGYGFADEVRTFKNSLINLSELLKKCQLLQDERLQLHTREKEIDKELNNILKIINEKVNKVGNQK